MVLDKARDFFPFLKDCGVKKTWAEKRPFRNPPLVKIDMVHCGEAILPTVHNVGLGKESLTLAWGTGAHVAHLVQEVSRSIKPFSRIMLPFNQLM